MFCKIELGMPAVIQSYSKGNTFRERIKSLNLCADRYFSLNYNQELYGEYRGLSKRAVELADFRNNIAHGAVAAWKRKETVFGVMVSSEDHNYTWCLSPAYYNHRKLVMVSEDRNRFRPTYFYFSSQINEFGFQFEQLNGRVIAFFRKIEALVYSSKHRPILLKSHRERTLGRSFVGPRPHPQQA